MKVILLGGVYFPVLSDPFTLENNIDKLNRSLVIRIKMTFTNFIVAKEEFQISDEKFDQALSSYDAIDCQIKDWLTKELERAQLVVNLSLIVNQTLGQAVL